jgi:hypothetical protein
MISNHSFHIERNNLIKVNYIKEGDFYYIKMSSSTIDVALNFEDCEHLQDIITSLQEQLDEIKEKGE